MLYVQSDPIIWITRKIFRYLFFTAQLKWKAFYVICLCQFTLGKPVPTWDSQPILQFFKVVLKWCAKLMFNFFCKFIKAFWHKIGIKRLESSRFLGILDIVSTERCLILLIFVTTDIHMLSKKKRLPKCLVGTNRKKGTGIFHSAC